MPTITIRDKDGKTFRAMKKLRTSQKEGNIFKDRSLAYIAFEILKSERSVASFVNEYVDEKKDGK